MCVLTDNLFLSSGFPFFVSGTSTPTGRFFPTHVGLCSHEDTAAWKVSYDFVKNVAGKSPKYRMGDGAKEITKAGKEVFKDPGVRLMCWPHTYRNVNNHLCSIRAEDSVWAKKAWLTLKS